jgi:1-phosphatidylinositol-3-phosphate 5-kinase
MKLLGFYMVEVRNQEARAVQAKADLLVIENLCYGQKPAKMFDLNVPVVLLSRMAPQGEGTRSRIVGHVIQAM